MPIDLDGRHARDLLSSSLSTSIVRVFFIYFILVQTKMIKKKKDEKKNRDTCPHSEGRRPLCQSVRS